MCTDPELQCSSANCVRQQHVNNRFIVLKKAQGQRHNYMGGCVIILCIFNVSLSALHFSLPTKSWYFHALSSVQFFILMSGFQCVLLFCFLGGSKTPICCSWWYQNYTSGCFLWHLWRMLQGHGDGHGCPSQALCQQTQEQQSLNINLKESEVKEKNVQGSAVATTAQYRSVSSH